MSTFKTPGLKLNVQKIKLPNRVNNSSIKNNTSSINKTEPYYENFLSVTPNTNKTNSNLAPNKNKPLPEIPTNTSTSLGQNSTSSGKVPAYNPNKGKAPQPPSNSSSINSNKLSSKKDPTTQEPIYENIDRITLQQKRPAYNPNKGPAPKPPSSANNTNSLNSTNNTNSTNNANTTTTNTNSINRNKLTSKNDTTVQEPIYENIDRITLQQKRPAYNPNKGPAPQPPKEEHIYEEIPDNAVYTSRSSLKLKTPLNP